MLLFMRDAVAYHPDLPFRIETFIFSASEKDPSQLSSILGIASAERNYDAQGSEPLPKLVILKVQTPYIFSHNLGYL